MIGCSKYSTNLLVDYSTLMVNIHSQQLLIMVKYKW